MLIKTSKTKCYSFIDLLETIDFELIWVYTLHCACEVTHNEVWINNHVLKQCSIYCTDLRGVMSSGLVRFRWWKCAALNQIIIGSIRELSQSPSLKAIDYPLLTLTCLCSAIGTLASISPSQYLQCWSFEVSLRSCGCQLMFLHAGDFLVLFGATNKWEIERWAVNMAIFKTGLGVSLI